jgi:hypothetical protein
MFAWYDMGLWFLYKRWGNVAVSLLVLCWLTATMLQLAHSFAQHPPPAIAAASRILKLLSVPLIGTALLVICLIFFEKAFFGYLAYVAGVSLLWVGYSGVSEELGRAEAEAREERSLAATSGSG